MDKLVAVALALFAIAAGTALAMKTRQTTPMDESDRSLTDFTVQDIKGKSVSLSEYKGKAVLIVNTASKCGLTPQYEALEALYQKYKDRGFVILGFPCNQFMGQEPGTNEEILEFCQTKFDVQFPMFSKVDVKGESASPLYKWLLAAQPNHSDIEWNFAKFLVSPDGKTVQRFGSRTKPDEESVVKAIESALPN